MLFFVPRSRIFRQIFRVKFCVFFSSPPMRVKYPAHLINLDLTTIAAEEYKEYSTSLRIDSTEHKKNINIYVWRRYTK
jgi:hypothetical protein